MDCDRGACLPTFPLLFNIVSMALKEQHRLGFINTPYIVTK